MISSRSVHSKDYKVDVPQGDAASGKPDQYQAHLGTMHRRLSSGGIYAGTADRLTKPRIGTYRYADTESHRCCRLLFVRDAQAVELVLQASKVLMPGFMECEPGVVSTGSPSLCRTITHRWKNSKITVVIDTTPFPTVCFCHASGYKENINL